MPVKDVKRRKMDKFFMAIRRICVAPVVAAGLLTVLAFSRFEIFSGAVQLILGYVFLGVLPILAYPLQRFIPHYKNAGRPGQRSLAMIFAVLGYILGCVFCLIFPATTGLWVIYLQYLLCGIAIFLFNKAFKLKISGHACGIVGPVMLLIYFGQYIAAAVGVIIAALVFIASVKTKRHTPWQLFGGTVVPIAVIALLWLIFRGAA